VVNRLHANFYNEETTELRLKESTELKNLEHNNKNIGTWILDTVRVFYACILKVVPGKKFIVDQKCSLD